MDKQTITTYNKMAREYDEETADFWDRFPRTFIDKFIEVSGEKILDVGSGPGRDGLLLEKAGKHVVCIDASEEMVKISRERGLKSILGNFENLSFADSTFDGVWSYTALLHIPKASIYKPLEEIKRVLKPSGTFALGLIEGDSEGYRESSGVTDSRFFSFFSKKEIEDIVKNMGFEMIYFESFKPRTKNYLNFIFKKL